MTEYSYKCSSSGSSWVFVWYCIPSGGGQIQPIPSANVRTPSPHLARFMAISFFKPIFFVFPFTCLFQVFFGCSHFLLPLTSKSRATRTILSPSLINTCLYHVTPLAVANSLQFPSTSASPSVLQSSSCQQLSDRTWLSPFSLKLLFYFFYTMSHLHIALLILCTTINFTFHLQRIP